MRVLLLHPEDSPALGPWSRERWDLVVDLGNSSVFSAEAWSRKFHSPVLRAASFHQGTQDVRRIRELFAAGLGRLLDEEGIDWWDLTSLLVTQEALTVLALRRLAAEISPSAELWATRSGGPANMLAILLESDLHTFDAKGITRSVANVLRYAGLIRRFSAGQIREIFLDKYDSGYQWRARFASPPLPSSEPVVLVPTAYGNVSRMAAAYAQLIPQQSCLMVATRQSGRELVRPANVHLRDLSSYATQSPPQSEITHLLDRWAQLKTDLCSLPEVRVLSQIGTLEPIADWIRNGLFVRNAWREVLEREPVCGVLCGDDSNRYTRLPVLLAARRKIPTVDFHHGAFDGRYLLKDLPCDLYLAKNEMERDYLVRVCGLRAGRIAIGAPAHAYPRPGIGEEQAERNSVIFFSEPYELGGMRAEEVYREVLPPLFRLAHENQRSLIIKLHPFESPSQRSLIVRNILLRDAELVKIVDGPPGNDLMSRAWFGITVESTSVVDCLQNGIQCFLCGWLQLSPFEYAQQYARFGVGAILETPEQVAGIPERLQDLANRPPTQWSLSPTVDPRLLQQWLTAGFAEPAPPRAVS